jgi:secreted trypsin-like serine protease
MGEYLSPINSLRLRSRSVLLSAVSLLATAAVYLLLAFHKSPIEASELMFLEANKESSTPSPKRTTRRKTIIDYDAPQPRIVNGTSTLPNQYPFMAALFKDDEFRCGGILIAPDIVLTAAHCAEFVNVVQIGRLNLTASSSTSFNQMIGSKDYEEFRIVAKAVHPNYRPRSYSKDVALLRLSKKSLNKPIKMNHDSNVPSEGEPLIVMGYGKTSEISLLSNTLLQTQVYYMTNDQCQESAYSNNEITSSMLCAAAPGTDACTGDSGGPLILRNKLININDASLQQQHTLVGVVSFGVGCADPNYPGVYARVSYNVDWIISTVCGNIMNSAASCIYLTGCKDVTSFISDGNEEKNCEWVGRRSSLRCPVYGKTFCPITCNQCGL